MPTFQNIINSIKGPEDSFKRRQDLIKEILSMLEAYKNAMGDNVLTDEERNILIPRIEKIFHGVLVVMNSIGDKGKGAY